jgi:hypothetical protein
MRPKGMRWTLAAGAATGLIVLVWVAGAAGASAGRLTLNAGRGYVTYGQSVALAGADTAAGRAIPHVSVIVQAQGFPFGGGFHKVAVGRTDAGGRYRITVRPDHATRYRVSVQRGAASPIVTVYVLASDLGSCNLCRSANTPGTRTLIVGDVYGLPPGPVAIQGPEYFYYGQHNGSLSLPATIRLVQTVPLRRIPGNRLKDTVSYQVHLPAGPSKFSYVTCFKDAEALDGVGLPGRHHCGDPTLTRAEYSGYVG